MKSLFTLFVCLGCLAAVSQNMHVKAFNYTGFPVREKNVTATLLQQSSALAQGHPEFGLLPYNTQCNNCVELIDRRTVDSRVYIDANDATHTYAQKSYFPLHYKNYEGDVWHSIDPRLKPLQGSPGVYAAANQPAPTACDLTKKCISIETDGHHFEFNHNLRLFFYNDTIAYTQATCVNYNQHTVGEDGLMVHDAWNGIDLQEKFGVGEVKTSFIIRSPLQLPLNSGYMVVEDKFTLPQGYSCVEGEGVHLTNDCFSGNYLIKDADGNAVIKYEKPVYYDSRVLGSATAYKLTHQNNNYTLQLFVPISWLANPDNVFPLVIDPTIVAVSALGNYKLSGLPSAYMGYTSMSLGSCDYHLSLLAPGQGQLNNMYVGIEYSLTYSPNCGGLIAPFCTFSQVYTEMICDSCQTSTGLFSCNPALPPYTGTCSTDSNLTAGSQVIDVNTLNSFFLSCLTSLDCGTPLSFTLKNQDSICGDMCGYDCAIGNKWIITAEATNSSLPPVISIQGDTLYSSVATGNQWFVDGVLIPGATGNIHVATIPGWYSVLVAGNNACMSNPIFFDTTCRASFGIVNGLFIGLDSNNYVAFSQCLGYSLHYVWDFGDGTSSTDQYPNHTYAVAGYYTVCLTVYNNTCSDSHCDSAYFFFKTMGPPMSQFTVLNPNALGLSETPFNQYVTVFPNPANKEIKIETGNWKPKEMGIYDLNGSLLIFENYKPDLKIDKLPAGVYMLVLKNNTETAYKRFVKM